MIFLPLLGLVLIAAAVTLLARGAIELAAPDCGHPRADRALRLRSRDRPRAPCRLPRPPRLRRREHRSPPHRQAQRHQRGAPEEAPHRGRHVPDDDAPGHRATRSSSPSHSRPSGSGWPIAAGASATLAILAAIFLAVLGWVAPGFLVQQRAEGRLYRIDRNMPELIDLLVVTVEAGLSLSAALQLAGERMKGPLGDELRIVLQEQRMGLTAGAGSREHDRPLPDAGGRVVRAGDDAGPAARRVCRGRSCAASPSRCASGAVRRSSSRRRRRRSRCSSRSSS